MTSATPFAVMKTQRATFPALHLNELSDHTVWGRIATAKLKRWPPNLQNAQQRFLKRSIPSGQS